MSEIVIKKKGIITTLKRENLIEIHETGDGVVFNFKHGLHLTYIDPHMPMTPKNIMKNAADSFNAKKIIFDLDNYTSPTSIDCT